MSEAANNRYGTNPYSPAQMPDLGDEPRSSKLTKTLIWPLLILSTLTTILSVVEMLTVDPEEYYSQVLPPEQLQDATPAMLDTMHTWSLISFIGFGLLMIILFVIVGIGLRATRPWARFTGLVFAFLFVLSEGLSLVFSVNYGQLEPLELVAAILTWLSVLLTIYWIIQAMSKPTSRWFSIHRRLQT